MNLRNWIASLAATVGLTATAGATELVTLYDVDFTAPTHSGDSRPTLGDGPPPRDTVSAIPFGNPIVSQYLTANWLLFAPPASPYEQVEFNSAGLPPCDRYVVEVDLAVPVLEPGSQFSVFVDVPSVRRVNFESDGTITFTVGGPEVQIGSWNAAMTTLRFEVDLTTDAIDVFYGGTRILADVFPDPGAFRSVRLSGFGDDYHVIVDRVFVEGELSVVPIVGRSWSELKTEF